MPKSKLTLIVDGNWLLMSRLSVLNKRYVDEYELNQELKLMLITSINVVLRTFSDIDNIIFVADGGSWRNSIEIPDYIYDCRKSEDQSVEYKGNRIKSSDINWDLLFESYGDFISTLQSNGITACQEQGVEGDDWCYHWSTYLNSQGTNCIIWTKDNDLKQLVNIDSNKCFTAWWNADNGLFVKDFPEEEFNFLFNTEFNINEDILNNIINKSKSVAKINPSEVIIDKIIRGDAGDNIYPILLRKSKNNSGKLFKVGAKDINYELDYHNDNEIQKYIHNLINSKNYIGRIDKSEENIVKHFKYNRCLVALEKDSYPQEILDIFEKYHDYNMSKDIEPAKNYIQASTNKLKGILDII
jgi:5'-3' exonuclease